MLTRLTPVMIRVEVFKGVFFPDFERSDNARMAVSATDSTPLMCTTSANKQTNTHSKMLKTMPRG